ncbi:F-box domain [Arabidopsis suecica]|uniref:F-box domain n=1 Tax=Arabidopsis suecica TaxID=45249 RepID=A0A8T1YN92_ARASU|nr:F-box domain [Arabidopsis suecica]
MEATKRGRVGSNHEASPTKLPYLPQEVITEILLRSHARSLGRFRCVSKPFHSLLSDPKFAKKHLDHNAVRLGHRRLILSSNNLFAVDLDSIRDGCEGLKDLTSVELDYPLKEDVDFLSEVYKKAQLKLNPDGTYSLGIYKKRWVCFFGSSNGLVCMANILSLNDVFLYNPTTGECKRVPDLPESLRSKSNKTSFSYGFGFDSQTNDYKVVKFIDGNDNYVYSLKTDSWRRICNMPYKDVCFTTSVELNGAIHWISILSGGVTTQQVVTAFDLTTEKFRVMSLPDLAEECKHIFQRSKVGILKGRLCVVYLCMKMHDVIWVMNEYGRESSWSKIRISVSYKRMIPLCSTKTNEEVILLLDGHLVLYNFERNTRRNLKIRGVEFDKSVGGNSYVESLISPNSYV